jgi:hypothetical protein
MMFNVFESYFSTFDQLYYEIDYHLGTIYNSDPEIYPYCFEEEVDINDCVLKGFKYTIFEELVPLYEYLYDVWPEDAHYNYMPYIEYNELLSQYAKQKVDSIGPCNGGT